MKKGLLLVLATLVLGVFVGCTAAEPEAKIEGEVKDSGGTPAPAGKGGAQEVDASR
jgi:hypothetical protein